MEHVSSFDGLEKKCIYVMTSNGVSEWELCEEEEQNLLEMFNWMGKEQEDEMEIFIFVKCKLCQTLAFLNQHA